nr:putative uncharacterized protein encoded by LINC00467 isoform X2 [Gorilla gorilla gorilla]
MDKKSTHRNPEDAKAGKYEGKHKRKKKRKQNQNQHRSQHRSVTSFSSDDPMFPSSSSSSSGSQTDSSIEVTQTLCRIPRRDRNESETGRPGRDAPHIPDWAAGQRCSPHLRPWAAGQRGSSLPRCDGGWEEALLVS